MHDASRTIHRCFRLAVAAGLLAAIPGCGPLATIAWLIHGPEMIPAEFDGLKGKRVAVVCLDANSLSGPGGEADAVSKAVAMTLVRLLTDSGLRKRLGAAGRARVERSFTWDRQAERLAELLSQAAG